jgi:DNA-binding NtrC family response regulator
MKTKSRVLIVDDEKVMRDSLTEWLALDNFAPVAADGGMTALRMVSEDPPDIMIVDIKMPGMDGVTLLRKVKESHPDIPVIMMTAFATVDNAVRSMKDGAYDFLTKPFPPEKLSNMLHHIMEHEQLKQENLRLQKERRHILHIAVSVLVSFIVLIVVLFFLFN